MSTPLPVEKIDPNGIREPDGIFPGSPDLRDLTNSKIGSWREFRATLRPRYGRAWMDIFFCLAMLFGGYAAHLGLNWRLGNLAGVLAAPVFAVWVGFWLNALLTFGHEAAHYNLSSSKVWNDFFADWSIWLFFPQSSKSYRKIHWQHHLHLGDLQDTEISYHNCMSPWFLAKALSGVYVVEVLARYALNKGTKPNPRKDEESANPITRQGTLVAVARAGAIHFVFVGAALYLRCYATAATWLVGAALVFPFLATVRQMLEHRDEEAHCATDYREVPQGAVNRMFGKNLFSRFYGAAGFNRHLLHHWDPTVSYTCFDEMENFLIETNLRERLERSRTTYVDNLILLTRKARRDLA